MFFNGKHVAKSSLLTRFVSFALSALLITSAGVQLQPGDAIAAAICPGGGTVATLETNSGGTLSSVTGATALDRTSPANLVANGDFTVEPAPLATSAQPNYYFWGPGGLTTYKTSTSINTNIPSWTASGGGTDTYAMWIKTNAAGTNASPKDPTLIAASANGQSAGRVYFGNKVVDSFSPIPSFDAAGYSTTQYTINPYRSGTYGTATTPPSISQNVALVVGKTYRMHFSQGTEAITQYTGMAAFEITGYQRTYFAVEANNHEYYVDFVAKAAQTNIKFMSWGHLTFNGYGDATVSPALTTNNISVTYKAMSGSKAVLTTPTAHGFVFGNNVNVSGVGAGYDGTYTVMSATSTTFSYIPSAYTATATTAVSPVGSAGLLTGVGGLSTELVLDDVIINECQTVASVPPAPTAVNDAQTTLWDVTQTYTPMTNDTAGSGTTLSSSSLKLCPTTATSPYTAANCNATSVTVSGEGVYTLSGTTVTFDPDSTFFGVVTTPVRYIIADVLGQTANATITPTIGPRATPDTLYLAAGTTASFTTITGASGIASGKALSTAGTFLCDPTTTPAQVYPNCSATTVTIAGVGVYILNQSTGVVSLAAAANATAGTKSPLTYMVTDVTGMTASSTLTPTIPGPVAATPETRYLAPGGTTTFTNITGSSSLATGTGLRTSGSGATCLIDPANTSNCGTTVTTADGTWSLDQATGVVTYTNTNTSPANNVGTKIVVTYRVTDVLGQTATSTLTPIIPAGPTAVNDTITTAWDTNQTYNPLSNDVAGLNQTINSSSLKLCATNVTSPFNLTNCTATSVTVAGEGTYTLSGTSVIFDPLPSFFGQAATPVRYVFADTSAQTASATITPVIGPKATPDTMFLLAGSTKKFATITGASGLANGASLDVSRTFLCDPAANQVAPNCSATNVTISGVGIYTLNQATGEVTLVADVGVTPGTKAALTYMVTDDVTGLTASSTLTPTIPGLPVATPEVIYLAPGASKTFTTITGGNGLASSQVGLVAASTCLIVPASNPATCDSDGVVQIPGEGTFTLNAATGVVTYAAESTATAGQKTQIRYQVTDTYGQKAISTLTPILAIPVAPAEPVAVEPTPTPTPTPTVTPVLLPKATPDHRRSTLNVAVGMSPVLNDIKGTANLVANSISLCKAKCATAAKATDPKTLSAKTADGTWTVNKDTGDVTFTPAKNWFGKTRLNYVIFDASGHPADSYLTVVIPKEKLPGELAYTGSVDLVFIGFLMLLALLLGVAMLRRAKSKID